MKVAITGGSGYIGTQVAARLSERHDVVICDVTTPDRDFDHPERIKYRECDVTDPSDCQSALSDADVVFHKAGLKGGVNSLEKPREYYDTNTVGTVNVIEACQRTDTEKLVFDSTESVFGTTNVEAPFSEDDVPSPSSMYGASKHISETYLRTIGNDAAFDVLSLRYPRIADPFHPNAIVRFANRLLDGEKITLYGDGTNTLDFTHIEDVIRIHEQCLTVDWEMDICHVSTDDAIELSDLVETIAEEADIPAQYDRIDRSDIAENIIEDDLLPHNNSLSNDRSKEKLNFQYSYPTVDDVIKDVVANLPREGTDDDDSE